MQGEADGARAPKAVIIGGSAAGLLAAALLRKAGWRAEIFEKSGVELVGRGAGIVCHPELLDALEASGAGSRDLGVAVAERIAFDARGEVFERRDHPQIVTSWDRLHQLCRAVIPDEIYHLGHELVSIAQGESAVEAIFANGQRVSGDILIGADGLRSAVRQCVSPGVDPVYAGYVIWRGLMDESAMPPDLHARIFEPFSFFLPPRNEILGYPIPGLNNDLAAGRRRYNWVWYKSASQTELDDMLTDESGRRHPLGISPALLKPTVVAAMRQQARAIIAPPLLDALDNIAAPFVTPIYDFFTPRFSFDRVVLIGDAAVTARPHIGYGTTKAAGDALALANALVAAADDHRAGLRAYDAERQPIGYRAYRRSRQLGSWMASDAAEVDRADQGEPGLHSVGGILRHTASNEFLTGQEVGRSAGGVRGLRNSAA